MSGGSYVDHGGFPISGITAREAAKVKESVVRG
jgi:hypothetical protein